MKIPFSWLKEYVATSLSIEQIADALTSIGLEVDAIEKSGSDQILHITFTPNLIHSASIRGVARELAAVTQEPLKEHLASLKESSEEQVHEHVSVKIEAEDATPRYCCRLIRGVHVGPSPSWLKEKLEKCGLRSINNVVDITNLVLLEFGHPLHAFDFDKIDEGQINVRMAFAGEKITTLDGQERTLFPDNLLICDAQKPIALAGIMGALESEVTDSTKNVLLESAYFHPSAIRRSRTRIELQTDASYHFERGTDPNGVIEALDRAASLIEEIAGGKAAHGKIDLKKKEFPLKEVSVRLSRVNHILGTKLALSELETLLRRQDFSITQTKNDQITVRVPTYRHDIHDEIDLIEEAARLYGFQNIRKTEKSFYRPGALTHCGEYLFERKVRCRLISEGLQEFLTCDLISPAQAELVSPGAFPSRALLKLLNPSSADQSVLRPSLLPGLLSVVRYNADHDLHSVSGFEVGRVHFKSKEQYLEPTVASIILAGSSSPYHWDTKEKPVDFYDLKGIVENLLETLKIDSFTFLPSHIESFHPGRQALVMVGSEEAGILGEVHPRILKEIGLEKPVYFAELNLEDLSRNVKKNLQMAQIPAFPASSRDWTITLDDRVNVSKLLEWIEKEHSSLLESVSILDVYRSDKLGLQRKNATFRFIYRDPSKTIAFSDVESVHAQITNRLLECISALIIDYKF